MHQLRMREFFRNIRAYQELVRCKQSRIDALRSSVEYTTPQTGSDTFSGSDPARRRTDAIVALLALEEELRKEVDAMMDAERLARKMIDSLSDPTAAWIFYRRYFDGWSWDRIIEQSGYERSWVYRIHGKAMQDLRKRFGEYVTVKGAGEAG